MVCFNVLPSRNSIAMLSPAILFANLVDGANVGMVQSGRGASLTAEAFEGLWVFSKVIGEEFQSHKAVKSCVLGLVHHTHSAPAKLFNDAVVGEGLADERVGVRHNAAMLGCVLRLSQRIAVNWRQTKH